MTLPVAPFQYPLSDQLALAKTYSGLSPINWPREYSKAAAVQQKSLFGLSLEEEIIAALPAIWKTCKSPAAQLKRLAKKMKIDDLKFLEKALLRATAMMKDEALFANYNAHADYFKWLESSDYLRHRGEYIAAADRRYQKNAIAADLDEADHYIEISGVRSSDNAELKSRLAPFDNSRMYMSDFAGMIGKNDFTRLKENGMITLLSGDPATLTQYKFKPVENPDPVAEIPRCATCSATLTSEIVGVNIKLGAHDPAHYKCYEHLGINEEDAKSLIEYYRSSGCPLFE